MDRNRKPDDYYKATTGVVGPVFWPDYSDLAASTLATPDDTDLLLVWDTSAGAFKGITFSDLAAAVIAKIP